MSAVKMINSGVEQFNQFANHVRNASKHAKEGFFRFGERTSHVLHEVYSLEGFEKLGACTALGCKILNIKGNLPDVLKAQKNLYYATKIFASPANYFKKDKNGHYQFALPRLFIVLMDIANVFETGKFFQNMGIYSFPRLQKIATTIGNYRLPLFNRQISQVPVLQSICDRPKELFVVIASGVSLTQRIPIICSQFARGKKIDVLNLLGAFSDASRGSLVILSRNYYQTHLFTLVEVIARSSGLISFILKTDKAREERKLRTGL